MNKANYFIVLFLIFVGMDIHCMKRRGMKRHVKQRKSKKDLRTALLCYRIFDYEDEEEDTKRIVKEMALYKNGSCASLDFATYEKMRFSFQAKFLEEVCRKIELGRDVSIPAVRTNGEINAEHQPKTLPKKNRTKRNKKVVKEVIGPWDRRLRTRHK